ncbi:hypothetical protein EDD86DRAFT_212300 [Gorgonomyces haynaldii]|nr:hypothetical protein EDD86DRAFT_212300 [Gorgonomyces haynaldii]
MGGFLLSHMSWLQITIPGCILSMLQLEFLNTPLSEDACGLLYGNRMDFDLTTTNDSGDSKQQKKVHVVYSFVPMKLVQPDGSLSINKLDPRCIGMFRFRRNAECKPSIRDVAAFQHLQRLSNQPQSLVFGVFSTNEDDESTFTFDFGFFQYLDGLKSVRVHVSSIGPGMMSKHLVPSAPVGSPQAQSVIQEMRDLEQQLFQRKHEHFKHTLSLLHVHLFILAGKRSFCCCRHCQIPS